MASHDDRSCFSASHLQPVATWASPRMVGTVSKLQLMGVYYTLHFVFAFHGYLSHHWNEEIKESKISESLPFALLRMDIQSSMKLCSLRGFPRHSPAPCTEHHPTRARVACSCEFLSLIAVAVTAGKTRSTLNSFCSGGGFTAFTLRRIFTSN